MWPKFFLLHWLVCSIFLSRLKHGNFSTYIETLVSPSLIPFTIFALSAFKDTTPLRSMTLDINIIGTSYQRVSVHSIVPLCPSGLSPTLTSPLRRMAKSDYWIGQRTSTCGLTCPVRRMNWITSSRLTPPSTTTRPFPTGLPNYSRGMLLGFVWQRMATVPWYFGFKGHPGHTLGDHWLFFNQWSPWLHH